MMSSCAGLTAAESDAADWSHQQLVGEEKGVCACVLSDGLGQLPECLCLLNSTYGGNSFAVISLEFTRLRLRGASYSISYNPIGRW